MSRRDRLSGRRRFAAVRAERISAGSGAVRVHLAPNGFDHPRLGFVIPKAIGGAVQRNTIRRRLRAALQPRRPLLDGLDVVVTVTGGAATAAAHSFQQLDADLARCLDRALPAALNRMRQRSGDAAGSQLAENGPVRPGPRRALAPTPV